MQSRSNASNLLSFINMKILYLLSNVCERLFDELVKELLLDRYTVVSGTFRQKDGRKIRVRKAHLRRRR